MKMLIFSKCRLFIIFLTFCYIFDNAACIAGVTNEKYYNGHPRKKLSNYFNIY